MARARSRPQHPWVLGWEAARANLVPALILQSGMLAILLGYYFSPPFAAALHHLAQYKHDHSFLFVIITAALAGAIIPEIFVILLFQHGRMHSRNWRNLAFTVPTWAVDGILVDLMYRLNVTWFGDVVTGPVVLAKICVDQFGYNPFLAAPGEVLVYEWKNQRFSWASLRRALTWSHYRSRVVPTLFATWAVWFPTMTIIYSLPYALQFPLFALALSFWVLLLTYMTNKFSPHAEVPPLFPTPETTE